MKFKFLGTKECPEVIKLRGKAFPKGKAVPVDPDLAAKLANLDYFAEVKPRDKKRARGRHPGAS